MNAMLQLAEVFTQPKSSRRFASVPEVAHAVSDAGVQMQVMEALEAYAIALEALAGRCLAATGERHLLAAPSAEVASLSHLSVTDLRARAEEALDTIRAALPDRTRGGLTW